MILNVIRSLIFVLCALICASGNVHAQTAGKVQIDTFDQRKLIVPHRNSDGTVKVAPFLTDPILWVRGQQQNFYSAMSNALRSTRDGNSSGAALTLLLLSFVYGVLHAAGPGHGKAVISAWLLATENQLRRGILVAFMSAIVQALTAITIITTLYLLVDGVGSAAKVVAGFLESASYGLIAVMGAYLFWTGVQTLWTKKFQAAGTADVQVSSDHHFEIVNHMSHEHGPDCDCGHAHLPTARDVSTSLTWSKAFSLAFAVGIRPCTGALLVLVFAKTLGIYWAGIGSTFAMALGTFITVTAVATLTVYSKKIAEGLAKRDTRWIDWMTIGLRLAAGSGIFLLGVILVLGSFGASPSNM